MPTDPVIPGGGRLTLQTTTNGRIVENVLGVTLPDGYSPSASDVDAMATNWWTTVRTIMSVDTAFTGATLRDLRVSPSVAYYGIVSTQTLDGTEQGNIAPPQVCALMQLQTGHGNRRGRGRLYVGPLVTSFLTGSGQQLTPAARNSINDAVNYGIQGIDGVHAGVYVGVLSQVDRVVRPLTNSSLETNLATQRRRIRN